MKNKFLKAVACVVASLLLLACSLPVAAAESTRTAGEAQSILDDIVTTKLEQSGAASVQQWIDGSLSKKAGSTSEWYVIALSQNGNYDFSAYETALLNYLAKKEVSSASSRQKYALALIATGSTDEYIYYTLNDSIGELGVMSWIYGLHLLNNGYSGNIYSQSAVIHQLLSLQLSDGGWAVMGKSGDVDATAMAMQALAPHYKKNSSVKSAIDKALSLLSERQQSTGDYANYGVSNPESTAQVLVALSSLGIDAMTDSRFIKSGNTLFDGIGNYRLSDGTFCHKQGGTSNEAATSQVLYSMVSYLRMENGKSPLYILDARNPAELNIPKTPASKPTETTPSDDSDESKESGSTNTGTATKPSSPSKKQDTTSEQTAGNDNTDAVTDEDTDAVAEGDSDTIIDTSTDEQTPITETPTEAEPESPHAESENSGNYKPWVCLAIVIVAGVICGIFWFLKKRNKKNFLVVLAVAALMIGFVLVTDFQSTDSYYQNTDVVKEDAIGTVSLTIRCDTIAGRSDSEYIPEDGVILDVKNFAIEDGDTVYDILKEATRKNEIHLETSDDASYVEGIHFIYEFDFGDLSGWVYHVNGSSPSIGCKEYELQDGDVIEWLYSCNLGEDLK